MVGIQTELSDPVTASAREVLLTASNIHSRNAAVMMKRERVPTVIRNVGSRHVYRTGIIHGSLKLRPWVAVEHCPGSVRGEVRGRCLIIRTGSADRTVTPPV
jgi:hypothetical protein